jgi:L-aspartate oxidase
VHFDVHDGSQNVDLTREGVHSARRILHFADHTGAEIHRALLAACRKHPNIEIKESHFAVDLILNRHVNPNDLNPPRCIGAYVLNRHTGDVSVEIAKSTILSTGGAGKVYLYTSNWSGATGDGIAMAYRAGARVANLEFMQFHPTCLYHRESRNFLISEALRGEGGELIDGRGNAFMKKYHPMGSLAPRDIVARSIDAEMKKSGDVCMYLDMRKHPREFLKQRFPMIFQRCEEYGIDMSTQPIPVVPAAHFLCGGVLADRSGRTDILGLWALGETACTGLHGANRLASNSLLECLAMAHNCAVEHDKISGQLTMPAEEPREWIHPQAANDDEMIVIHHMWDEIRRLMWNYVGIVRSNKRLERASHRLTNILEEVKDYYSNCKLHSDILELRNIALVAELSVQCALRRKESRGIHYNLDYPWADWHEDDETRGLAGDTILSRGL